MTDAPTLLCVIHHGPDDVGLVERWAQARGLAVDIRKPLKGDALPPPGTVAGAVIFGGAMSANDEHLGGVAAELRWLDAALAAGAPVLGLCLGGQMIARALGARVARRADRLWEIGWREIDPTEAGAPVFGGVRRFFQWHGEGFDLPAGATRLAGGPLFPEQAFAHGAAVGFQFHPEPTAEMLAGWRARHEDDMRQPGADPLDRQAADEPRFLPAVEAWLPGFLDGWIARRAPSGA